MPSRDYEEFIAALNAHGVRYLVVGAHAVAFHGRPRATKDLDLLLDPSPENAAGTLAALREFFGTDLGYSIDDLTDPGWFIQLGVAPVRIDLLTSLSGVPDFNTLWEHRVQGEFGGVPTAYVALDDLIHAKQAADRPQDRADVRSLLKLRSRRR